MSRFQWTQTLETYIRQRLGDRSGGGAPRGLVHSQFVLDGIVLAVNDHPTAATESHVAIVNCIRGAHRALMAASAASSAGAGPEAEAEAEAAGASAAADLYTAWCVLDAVCKGTIVAELHECFCASLPELVGDCMPLYCPPSLSSSSSPPDGLAQLRAAAAAYGPAYWAMVRSWLAGSVFPQHVIDACSAALEGQVARYAPAAGSDGALGGNGYGDDGAPSASPSAAAAEAQGSAVARLLAGQGAGLNAAAASASGAGAIAAALNGFYSVRATKDGHMCLECGVAMPTADALREHKNYHRYLLAEPNKHLSRLLAPPVSAYVGFVGGHSSGRFARVAVPQSEVTGPESARVRPPRG